MAQPLPGGQRGPVRRVLRRERPHRLVLGPGAVRDRRRLHAARRVRPDRRLLRCPARARPGQRHLPGHPRRRADPQHRGSARHAVAGDGHRQPGHRHAVHVHRRPRPRLPGRRPLVDPARHRAVDLARRRPRGRPEPHGAEGVRRLRRRAALAVRGRRRGLVLQERRVGHHRSRLADEQLAAATHRVRAGQGRRDHRLDPPARPGHARGTRPVAAHAGAVGRQGRQDRLHELGVAVDAPVVRRHPQGDGRAPPHGRFPRFHDPEGHPAHLAAGHDHGGRRR